MTIEATKRLAKEEECTFLIQYGSSIRQGIRQARDYDFLLIIKEGRRKNIEENFQIGKADIIRESERAFREYLRIKDPIYATEAVLEGELILGNLDKFQHIRQKLKSSDAADIHYLFRQFLDEHWKCYVLLENNNLAKSLKALNYAISYRLFSQWYKENNRVISWAELKKKVGGGLDELLNTIEKLRRKLKNGFQVKNNPTETEALLEVWEDILLNENFRFFVRP